MNVDPKLENIAKKVLDKMDLSSSSKNNKYGSVIAILMVISIIINLIRVIQACHSSEIGGRDRYQQAGFMYKEARKLCIARTMLNKWRLRTIIKNKLSPEDYKLYGNKLRDAILDTGANLTEDESLTLMEAANV